MTPKTNGTVANGGAAGEFYYVFTGAQTPVTFRGKKELKFDRGVPRQVSSLYEMDIEKNLNYLKLTKDDALPWLKKMHEAPDFAAQMRIRLDLLAELKKDRDKKKRDWVEAEEKKRDEKKVKLDDATSGLVEIPEFVEEAAVEILGKIEAELAIEGTGIDDVRRTAIERDLLLISKGSTLRTQHGLRRLKKIYDEITAAKKAMPPPKEKGQAKKDLAKEPPAGGDAGDQGGGT